jgi:2'-5' RNA ligase
VSAASARLFLALELPSEGRASLARWAEENLDGVAGLRRLDPEAMHLTLCFLGWQGQAEVELATSVCQSLGSEQRAVTTAPGRVLWLPRRRPGVVAIELVGVAQEDDRRLRALQARLAGALQDAGLYEPERRPFLAHVTVARVRGDARVRPVELPAPEPGTGLSLSTLTLFRSHLGRGGARYEPLVRVPLAGG